MSEQRLIDADTLQTALVDEYQTIAGFKTREQFYRAIEIAKKQPTVPAEVVVPVVHGYWTFNTDDFTPAKRCSACGYNKPECAGENIKREPESYCPNCGAKMNRESEAGK